MKRKKIGVIIIVLIAIILSIFLYNQFKTLQYIEQKKKESFFLEMASRSKCGEIALSYFQIHQGLQQGSLYS
jgi:hypothetical protein